MRGRAPAGVRSHVRLRVLLGWVWLCWSVAFAWGWDLARGRGSANSRAARLCAALVRLGPTATRLGQYAARRLELLTPPYQAALGRLRDDAPPIPVDVAVGLAERAAGAPFDSVYASFDPVPIASTSSACAYQAVLREGDKVVVKVRRPDAPERFAAHLDAVGALFFLVEATSLVRPGTFKQLRLELRDMAEGDLDFRGVARSHRLFRKRARRDRLRHVTAARIHHRYCSDDVTVSEFVAGVRCSEVVAARETGDARALAQLRAMGIDPRTTARRLLQAAWWSYFEGVLFNAECFASEIVVRPGGRIVYVDLGDCGHTIRQNQRLQRRILERLWRNDVGGAAEAAVQLLSPLPFIDVFEFRKAIEARFWTQLFALRDRRAPPEERTSAGVWLAILECAYEHGVPVRLDTVQMMRACAMTDGLVADLWPKVRYFREFERYLRRARRRSARRLERRALELADEGLLTRALATLEDVSAGAQRLGFWVEMATRNPPVDFMAVSKKASYVASAVLRFTAATLSLFVVFAVGAHVTAAVTGREPDLGHLVESVPGNPVFLGVLVLLAAVTLRRILFRLDDMDRDD